MSSPFGNTNPPAQNTDEEEIAGSPEAITSIVLGGLNTPHPNPPAPAFFPPPGTAGSPVPPVDASHAAAAPLVPVAPLPPANSLNPTAASFVPVPVAPPPPPPTQVQLFQQLVDALLNAPRRPSDRDGWVTIEWPFVLRTVQSAAFQQWAGDFPNVDNHRVLRPSSDLDLYGAQFGMPPEYLNWLLAGDNILSIRWDRLQQGRFLAQAGGQMTIPGGFGGKGGGGGGPPPAGGAGGVAC